MLREAKGPSAQTRTSECDCGILKEISDGLEEVVEKKEGDDKTLKLKSSFFKILSSRFVTQKTSK